MISTFFDKTKPINYIVVLGFSFLAFWATNLGAHGFVPKGTGVLVNILASIALMASLFLVGHIVKVRKLTSDNSFAMLFFSLLLLVFFEVLRYPNLVFCNFFVLISVNRVLSLRSEKKHDKKVFESALWIFVASFFLQWAILFLVPLYIAITAFSAKQMRIWLMPLASFGAVFIMTMATLSLFGNTGFLANHYHFELSLDFFSQPRYGILVYIPLMVVVVFVVFGKMGYLRLGRMLSIRLVLAYLMISFLMVLFSPQFEQGIALFSFFPAAVFLTNYIETIKNNRYREMLILACIILPLLGFVIGLAQ